MAISLTFLSSSFSSRTLDATRSECVRFHESFVSSHGRFETSHEWNVVSSSGLIVEPGRPGLTNSKMCPIDATILYD